MTGIISSRTPEGVPNHCPICEAPIDVEPSPPAGDAPCPSCGILLWFVKASSGCYFFESEAIAALRERVLRVVCENLGLNKDEVTDFTAFPEDGGTDSLDRVKLIMELEEEFDIDIPEEDARDLQTVGDLVGYLARRGL